MTDEQANGANLFLFGAARTGSTQLARWLDSHPDIALSAIKEPNHFSAGDFPASYVAAHHLNDVAPDQVPTRATQFAVIRDKSDYVRLFSGLETRWRLDASTTYLPCVGAPVAIRTAAPNARIIVLTRDPVERAISHYGLAVRTGRTRGTLGDALAAEMAGSLPPGACFLLRPSRQRAGLDRVRATFPARQILELRFEEMVRDPRGTLALIGSFLRLDPTGFDLSVQARNETAMPRFGVLNGWLLTSGIKTRLRQTLPAWAKPALKRLWFDASRKPKVSDLERSALAALLADEYDPQARP
jgi:hypothetical protein